MVKHQGAFAAPQGANLETGAKTRKRILAKGPSGGRLWNHSDRVAIAGDVAVIENQLKQITPCRAHERIPVIRSRTFRSHCLIAVAVKNAAQVLLAVGTVLPVDSIDRHLAFDGIFVEDVIAFSIERLLQQPLENPISLPGVFPTCRIDNARRFALPV
jgi:hypothetical protein